MGWRPLIVFLAVFTGAAPGLAQQITAARYDAPTTRYAHGVLGDAVEWGALVLTLAGGEETRLTLPETRVFEDVAPRLADLDGDGNPEVIVVESSVSRGARLGVYDADGLRAATPHIGRPNRWLAPVGAADLDGDGSVEIAYVDRPHLAKRLRVWRYEDGGLDHVADLGGLTNHKIGWDFIAGGIRDCGNGPEIITADSDWRNVVATRFSAGKLTPRDIAPYSGPGSVQTELECGG
ncbi:VCBS repeat-containing protein [Roseovarius sp. TE539]|uniref:FG-GAP repeat domain-containing protein n=1 Tax=Roseovarius sp. TE539 TaxID=2249812 RepID=UPI00215C5E4F|nr:VCBS repeat-containing protein [Roseovarius sp. TE539]